MNASVQGMTGRRILIVGGGCAGITTAATLKKHDPSLEIAIIEPSDRHWYQPGLTLVGAGIFTREQTERREETLIPKGVRWIRKAATEFLPDQNAVRLQDNTLESSGDITTYTISEYLRPWGRDLYTQCKNRSRRSDAGSGRRQESARCDEGTKGRSGVRRIRLLPAYRCERQDCTGRIRVWRQGHAKFSPRSARPAAQHVVFENQIPAMALLESYVQRQEVRSAAQGKKLLDRGVKRLQINVPPENRSIASSVTSVANFLFLRFGAMSPVQDDECRE